MDETPSSAPDDGKFGADLIGVAAAVVGVAAVLLLVIGVGVLAVMAVGYYS